MTNPESDHATPEERRRAIAEILARGYRRLLDRRPPPQDAEVARGRIHRSRRKASEVSAESVTRESSS
jgi:hypothetical protein